MRINALVFEKKGKVGIQTTELPDPEYNEVQIEIKACGICAGDLNQYCGITVEGDYPYGFGHEGAGVISKLGAGVSGYKIGDKVACVYDPASHMMAQAANVHVNRTVRIPEDTVDFSDWIIEPVACVANGIHVANIQIGDKIALVGAGFMGLLLAQGISHTLAGELVVFDVEQKRLDMVPKAPHITTCCLSTKEGKSALEKFQKQSDFDIVIEASGSAGGLATAQSLLKTAGKLQMFGWQRGLREIDGTQWHLNGWQICNASPFCNVHYEELLPGVVKSMENRFFDLRPLITHRYDYRRADELFQLGTKKADGYIKGVILF